MAKPTQKPIIGESTSASRTLATPMTCPLPQVGEAPDHVVGAGGDHDHARQPADQGVRRRGGKAAPPGDAGSRRWRRGGRRIRCIASGSIREVTNVPMVLATAVPPSSGPRNSKKATSSTACTGVIAREAMTVAMMLAASWNPLVYSNTSTNATAMTVSTARVVMMPSSVLGESAGRARICGVRPKVASATGVVKSRDVPKGRSCAERTHPRDERETPRALREMRIKTADQQGVSNRCSIADRKVDER